MSETIERLREALERFETGGPEDVRAAIGVMLRSLGPFDGPVEPSQLVDDVVWLVRGES